MRRIVTLLLFSLSLQAAERFIRIDFPNGGELLRGGSEVRVLWHSLGVEGDLAILLFKDGEQYAVLADSVPNSGSFQWKISPSLPDGGRYRLRRRR